MAAMAVIAASPSGPIGVLKEMFAVGKGLGRGRRGLAALLGRKAPGEAEGFKGWLLGSAQGVAEAAKEGGVFGIGGVQVSEAEKTALAEVAQALGVKA